MNIPGFNAEASLYRASGGHYHVAGSLNQSAPTIQPALTPIQMPKAPMVRPPRGGCWAICGGDPDCIDCCECLRHGGHPWECCF